MFSFVKQPSEETTRAVDVAGMAEIRAGETIGSVTVTVSLVMGNIQPSMLVSSNISGTQIYFRVRGGERDKDYKITVQIITSGGHRREIDIIMYVREI